MSSVNRGRTIRPWTPVWRDLLAVLYLEWQSQLRSWRMALQWASGPLLTLVLFAPVMANTVRTVTWGAGSTGYAAYFLPGLLVMNAFVAGQSAGVPVWLDRMTGELEVHFGLPVRREVLLLGRVAGAVASTFLQALIVLAAGLWLAPSVLTADPLRWASAIGVASLVALGVGLASILGCCLIKDQENLNLFINLLSTPLILTSSIYYPIEAMPAWLRPLALVNPLSHGAALTRSILGAGLAQSVTVPTLYLAAFAVLAYLGAAWAFRRAVR